jgi:hypothetical protein
VRDFRFSWWRLRSRSYGLWRRVVFSRLPKFRKTILPPPSDWWRQQCPPKSWYHTAVLPDVTTQNTSTWVCSSSNGISVTIQGAVWVRGHTRFAFGNNVLRYCGQLFPHRSWVHVSRTLDIRASCLLGSLNKHSISTVHNTVHVLAVVPKRVFHRSELCFGCFHTACTYWPEQREEFIVAIGLFLLWFDPRRGLEIFLFHHRVQNGSGAHPASYPMGTRGCFPGGEAAVERSWPLTSI